MTNYYDDPSLYDLEYDIRKEDIHFYIEKCHEQLNKNLKDHNKNKSKKLEVLELGCGTGRVSIPLAKEGFIISAIDSDKKMLTHAKEKALKENLKIDFIKADFRNFNIGKKFDVVIMPFNSLQHLHRIEDINKFFNNLKRHISENGIFMFEVTNPDMDDLSRGPDDVVPYDSFNVIRDSKTGKLSRITDHKNLGDQEKAQLLVIEDFLDYDVKNQIANFTLHYSIDYEEDIAILKISLRVFFPQELDSILHYNGFKILEKYGYFDKKPLSVKSPSQVLICRAQNL